jgi:leucyl-tRNA synthetase
MQKYDHEKIEKKWQERWEKSQAHTAPDNQGEKNYLLIEFPYPSGDGLHVGHVRSWTALDVVARKRRMEGKNVLYPIGWDAFGLPTENYAIKTGRNPKDVTKENTDNFRRQIKSVGLSFDWSREINTTDPAYYKWTQWIFLKLFEKGLAYKAKTLINWCPKDKIGLANEEVVDGCCERCGTPVEKREKEQWMLAITKYAKRLYDDLDLVDYIERAKVQQRNWIGPSEGAEIDFDTTVGEKVKIFTTRPDTLFGATYMVIAPEHALLKIFAQKSENEKEILEYAQSAKNRSEIDRTAEGKEKTGVEIKGIKAINPASGEQIPIFVADYVLAGYGTGAIMAVPAHDERDFAFAKKFDLPIKYVIEPETGKKLSHEQYRSSIAAIVEDPKTGKILTLNWGPTLGGTLLIGGGREEGEDPETTARREIREETGYTNLELVSMTGRAHHHYFAFSKNVARYIEAVGLYFKLTGDEKEEIDHQADEKNNFKVEWLTKEDLVSKLKDELHIVCFNQLVLGKPYTGKGILKNSGEFDGTSSEDAKKKITEAVGGKMVTTFKLRDWVFSRQRYWGEPIPMIKCEKDGWVPVPVEQLPVTLPEVEKYQPTDTGESPLSTMNEWVQTTCPTCGGPARRETDVMPNWAGSSWYYLRYTDPNNASAFASKDKLEYWTPVDWYNGGMEHTVLHLLYSRFWHKFLYDLTLVPTPEPYMKRTSHGLILAEDGSKMSKSKGNTVSPDEIVKMFGADSLRMYEMFIGPFDQPVSWSTSSIMGVRRFLERVWKLSVDESVQAEVILDPTIKKIGDDIEALKMNTAVSSLMTALKMLEDLDSVPRTAYETFLKLLSPFAPHIASELAEAHSINILSWPRFDETKLVASTVTLAVQINGKARGTISIGKDASKEQAIAAVGADPAIAKWLPPGALQEGESGVKVIYVPQKVISFVSPKGS